MGYGRASVDGDRFKMVVESGLKRIGVQGGMDSGYVCPTVYLMCDK